MIAAMRDVPKGNYVISPSLPQIPLKAQILSLFGHSTLLGTIEFEVYKTKFG